MSPASKGVFYGILAYLLWGSLPIYWKQLGSLAPATIIAHRILWGLATLLPLLIYRKSIHRYFQMWKNPRSIATATVSGCLLAVNWLIYLWATLNGKVVEVALGYYILPLIYVLLGYLIFRETMNRWQLGAVILATAGITLQTIGIGELPWSALGVAFSFALYALLKKRTASDGLSALSMELSSISLLAFGFLLWAAPASGPVLGDGSTATIFYITLTGIATIAPLLFFAAAAKRIKLSTLGMLQFIAPTGQFLTGWLYYREPVSSLQLYAFSLIWLAIFCYSFGSKR